MRASLVVLLLCGSALAEVTSGRLAMKDGDYARAFVEFEPLAKQGDAEAEFFLGVLYGGGLGVKRNYDVAASLYRSAAAQGFTTAQLYIGMLYEDGKEGFPQDLKEAVRWYRLAADAGNGNAQHLLGYMCSQGVGTLQDYVEGYMWLNLACAAGTEACKERDLASRMMTPDQIAEGQRRSREWKPKPAK